MHCSKGLPSLAAPYQSLLNWKEATTTTGRVARIERLRMFLSRNVHHIELFQLNKD
jgi:hypothetical protein